MGGCCGCDCGGGRSGEGSQRVLQLWRCHAAVAGPEVNHFFQGRDADGVDERAAALLGAGGPFGEFACYEDVEGQLTSHEAFLARVFGDRVQKLFGSEGVLGVFRFIACGQAVEFDVAGAGDVIVESVGPVVQLDAFEETDGAVFVAVEVHEIQGSLKGPQGFDLFQGRGSVGGRGDVDGFL